ncbi:unnamed protein product [Sphagnum troendelagicum]|uniref:Phosphatase 2A Regulatory Subunit A helical domain-containing protein n=1 Tax=Sphagnum troendelagicum TaxID=128251 RepID=A0ABP0TMC0_9BRYO
MVGKFKPPGQSRCSAHKQVMWTAHVQDATDIDPFEDSIKEHQKDAGRSREEIEHLTVDEDLSDIERAQLFLSPTAHLLQQSCALGRLPLLFKEYGLAAVEALFPAFVSSVESFSYHCQVAAGEAFTLILQDKSMPKEVAIRLLPMVLHMVKIPRSNEVLHTWLCTLQVLIPLLPLQVVTGDVMKMALSKGEGEESVQAHKVCCTMLGAIAPMLEAKDIIQNFLPKTMGFCQDTDLEVRLCMCQQLNAISRAVGVDTFMVFVFPELNELLKDEEVVVQVAAVQALVNLLDFLPSRIHTADVLPFIHSLCPTETPVLICLARLFGDIALKMVLDMSDEDVQSLVDSYKELAQNSNEEIRQLCAYNFPAILKAIGTRKYFIMLHHTYVQLAQDIAPAVRSTIAASFHEGFLSSDQIYDNFLPLCFQYMTENVLPVRTAAALALAVFIRCNCRAVQRYELSQRVVREYGQAHSYWLRLLYIDFCEHMLKIASSRMFKDSFLDTAVLTLQDAVPSVRMRACQIINPLRAVIKLPDDVSTLERINHLATQRLNDTDREVVAAARIAADNQKRVFVQDHEATNDHVSSQDEYEKEDKHREEEEWHMLSKDEQEEKQKLDETLHRLKLDLKRGLGAEQSRSISTNLSTLLSDSSTTRHTTKAVSTNRGLTNGSHLNIDQGRPWTRSSISGSKTKLVQHPTSGPQTSANPPQSSSGSSQHQPTIQKRGSISITKPGPPSPGSAMLSHGVHSSLTNPSSDTVTDTNVPTARRANYKTPPTFKRASNSG